MKHLPCKTDKCILFPICIGQRVIDCNELIKWYEYYKKERGVKPRTVWRALSNTLPNLETIIGPVKRNNIPQPYYFQHNIINQNYGEWTAEGEL